MVLPSLGQTTVDSVLDAWVDGGGTMVDTARIYGRGQSEEMLGKWLARDGNRQRIMLLTKGCHHDNVGPRVTADALRMDLEQSLEALQTDHIELYLLHRDDPNVPAGEIVGWLDEHRKAGRIGAFGGSNWSVGRVQETYEYSMRVGVEGFAATSNYFGLATANEDMWPGVELINSDDKQWYEKTGTANFAWSSLGRGYFAGRGEGEEADEDVARVYVNDTNDERRRRALEVGQTKGLTAVQIAGSYAICQPFASIALVGCASVDEVEAVLHASDIELTPEEVTYLENGH
jgi:aryl-alcohol dehydrogenase-like predicted oxidoreductase